MLDGICMINKKTIDTPSVNFDEKSYTLNIEGKSYMEDSFSFYDDVLEWIKSYLLKNKQIVITMELIYINSTSSKAIYDLFNSLQEEKIKNNNIKLIWRYDEENYMMQETGEDFQEDFENLSIVLEPHE